MNRYKLVVGDQDNGIGFWTGPLYPNGTANVPSKSAYGCSQGCLFDIQADPTGVSRPVWVSFMPQPSHLYLLVVCNYWLCSFL